MAAPKLNTSGSIVISDESDTDTDYEPDVKRSKLEEDLKEVGPGGTTAVVPANQKETGGDQASSSSSKERWAVAEDNETKPSLTTSTELPAAQPSSSQSAAKDTTIFHTCNGSFTLEEIMEKLAKDKEKQNERRRSIRRFGIRNRRRGSNSQSQDEVQNVSNDDVASDTGSFCPDSNASTSCTENDEKDLLSISISQPVVPKVDNGYLTDPVDSDEIPSDLEFSPPRPPTPPRPSQRYIYNRERRNAIFEPRDPPPVSIQQMEDEQFYYNELEVASNGDINENPIEDANSTSGAEVENQDDSVAGILNETIRGTSDLDSDDNFADSETMKSDKEKEVNSDETHNSSVRSNKGLNSSDSEISEKDKWYCSSCHAVSMPYLRYCSRCFNIRRNWLPKRPPSRRLKRRKRAERRDNSSNISRTTVTSDSDDVVDGPPRRNAESSQSQEQSSSATAGTNGAGHTDPPRASRQLSSLPGRLPVDLDEGFLIDNENPALHRLDSHTRPGNVTLIGIFTPPDTQLSISQDGAVDEASQKSDGAADEASQKSDGAADEASQKSDGATSTTEVDSSSVATSSQSQSTSSSQSQPLSQGSSQQSTQSSSEFLSPPLPKSKQNQSICNICYCRAKDAAFVHNRVAHQYCCYPCADRILKKDGKCPICRERVLRVVRVIVV